MSNSTNSTYHRGDTVCRRTDWVDIAKFFLLNYGLHAVTVLMEPGSTPLACLLASFTDVMLPSDGVARSVRAIFRFAIWGTTDLEVALRSGALCMLVPAHLPTRPLQPTTTPEAESSKLKKETPERLHDTQPSQRMSNDPDQILSGPPGLNSSEETAPREQELEDYWKRIMNTFFPISVDLTQVHGEYPKDLKWRGSRLPGPEEGAVEERGTQEPLHRKCILMDVPRDFQVCGLVGPLKTKDRYEVIMDFFERYVIRSEKTDGRGENAIPVPTTSVADSEPEATSTTKSGPRRTVIALPVRSSPPAPANAVDLRISSNYSFVKTVAAIIQIIYGSLELYKIGKDQIDQNGYTTYQLTVIPYIFMSLANLIASLLGPRYPSKYLVYYRGLRKPSTGEGENDLYPPGWWGDEDRGQVEKQISGIVGQVYGSFLKNGERTLEGRVLGGPVIEEYSPQRRGYHLVKSVGINLHRIFTFLFALVFLTGPYFTIYLLAGYRAGNSTISQQRWIMFWYLFGYTGQSFLSFFVIFPAFRKFGIMNPRLALVIIMTCTALLSIPTIGGLVVVAQMMIDDDTCKIL